MTLKSSKILVVSLVLIALFAFGCGAGSSASSLLNPNNPNSPSPVPGTTPAALTSSTVFVVVMENKNFSDVFNNVSMPYLNSLYPKGSVATNYDANAHPSIPNYFMMTTGNIETLDDGFTGVISDDNIVRQLVAGGKTWKAYAESIPSAGYLGGDVQPYLRRHNPFSYFSDVQSNPAQATNIVPLTQLSSDLSSGQLPNVAFIIPNAYGQGHDCAPATPNCTMAQQLQQSDAWLSANLPAVLGNATFQKSGTLVVTWDESSTDLTNGGGKVLTFLIGAHVKAGYQSTSSYQHQDLLKMIMTQAGLSTAPGIAGNASTMAEFFQ